MILIVLIRIKIRIKKKRSNPLEIRIEYVCSFVSQKYDIRYGYAKLLI